MSPLHTSFVGCSVVGGGGTASFGDGHDSRGRPVLRGRGHREVALIGAGREHTIGTDGASGRASRR